MSNDVYTESFFANKQIPMCEKLGFIALVQGGTNDKNATPYNGNGKCFSSIVFDRRGRKTPIMFTYSHPESLNELACRTLLHSMGLDVVIPIDKFFDGSMSDEEIIGKLEDFYRGNPNIDKSKFPVNFETIRQPNIKYYVEQLKNTDSYLADNPKILESLVSKTNEICGLKKNEMTNKD